MGANDTVASIISSLAWPSVVLVAIILLRGSLRNLLGRLTSYEGAGQKITFAQQLGEVEYKAESAAEASTKGQGSPDNESPSVSLPTAASEPIDLEQIATLAAVSPPGAILTAWQEVERSLDELYAVAEGVGRAKSYRRNAAVDKITALRKGEVLSPLITDALNGLRRLRNTAVHAIEPISEGEAFRFAELSNEVISGMNLVRQNLLREEG